eukprot:UN05024
MGDGKSCYNVCMHIFTAQGIFGDNGMGEKFAPLGYGSVERRVFNLGPNMMTSFQSFPTPAVVQIRYPGADMNTEVFNVMKDSLGEFVEWEKCTGRHNCSSLRLEPTETSPNPLYLVLPRSTSGGLCINKRRDRAPYTFTCDGNDGQLVQAGMIDGENKEMGCDCPILGNCFVAKFEDDPVCMPLGSYAELWACFDEVDQCLTGIDNCDLNAECTNLPGAKFQCECNDGYEGDGHTCNDIDECADGTHECHINATCTNGGGSYKCGCNDGYFGTGKVCQDTDECIEGTHNCANHSICFNTPGSFDCMCKQGYEGDGTTCTDIDECSRGLDSCDREHSDCVNVPGHYQCKCREGFFGDGMDGCTEHAQCQIPDNCRVNSHCVNTEKSHMCVCDSGYEEKETCEVLSVAQCNARIIDHTRGSPSNALRITDQTQPVEAPAENCGSMCEQTNRCMAWTYGWTSEDGDTNLGRCDMFTTNDDNSLRFESGHAEFKSGLCDITGTRSICEVFCGDINECTEHRHNCNANAECINEPGSYSCKCRKGYSGDGLKCLDINECFLPSDDPQSHNCDIHAKCSNKIGSFKCDCNEGYTGSGVECAKTGCMKEAAFNFDRMAVVEDTCCFGEDLLKEKKEKIDKCYADKEAYKQRYLFVYGSINANVALLEEEAEEGEIEEVRRLLHTYVPEDEWSLVEDDLQELLR